MREETVLSLKWHSFPTHLAVSLDTCYEKQQFVDLSLVCKDGTILKCHKMVLANSSSFFRRLLVANDHPHPMIILHDVEADELKTIINFMYCGEIQVVKSEVKKLLKLAEILEVKGLRHIQTSFSEGDGNNGSPEVSQKTTTVSRLKLEEPKVLATKIVSEPEANIKTPQIKQTPNLTKFVPILPKPILKLPSQSTKKADESNFNSFSQRLEIGKSGVNIVDVNDMPSTSRGYPNLPLHKRKGPSDPVISWPSVLSAISKDESLPLKKLCIMDEVEITAGKPPATTQDPKWNEPLDRRKPINNYNMSGGHLMNCAVFIKDEVDIPPEMEEDIDMDPLEVEEIENENSENFSASGQLFSFTTIDQTTMNTGTFPEFTRKSSNG